MKIFTLNIDDAQAILNLLLFNAKSPLVKFNQVILIKRT